MFSKKDLQQLIVPLIIEQIPLWFRSAEKLPYPAFLW